MGVVGIFGRTETKSPSSMHMPWLGSIITTKIDNDMLVIKVLLLALLVSGPEIEMGRGEITDALALIRCLVRDFFVVLGPLVME